MPTGSVTRSQNEVGVVWASPADAHTLTFTFPPHNYNNVTYTITVSFTLGTGSFSVIQKMTISGGTNTNVQYSGPFLGTPPVQQTPSQGFWPFTPPHLASILSQLNTTQSATIDLSWFGNSNGFPITVTDFQIVATFNDPTCTYGITPTSASYTVSGGSSTVSMSDTSSLCPNSAVSNNAFITVTAFNAFGPGNVFYSVATNTGSARSGTITINGKAFTVNQDGVAACTYSLDPASRSIPATAGSDSFDIATQAGCAGTTTTATSWLHVTSTTPWTGPTTATYTYDANSGAQRVGTITAGGQTFTVTQASVSAPDQPVPPGGAFDDCDNSITLTTPTVSGATSYKFYDGATLLQSSPLTSINIPAPSVGTHPYSVVVTNAGGASAASPPTVIVVPLWRRCGSIVLEAVWSRRCAQAATWTRRCPGE